MSAECWDKISVVLMGVKTVELTALNLAVWMAQTRADCSEYSKAGWRAERTVGRWGSHLEQSSAAQLALMMAVCWAQNLEYSQVVRLVQKWAGHLAEHLE